MRSVRVYPVFCALLVVVLAGALPAYQSPEVRLVLVSTLDGPALPADLRVLEDYGAFVLAEVPAEDLPALEARYLVDPLPERTVVSLNGTVFDTRSGEPGIASELRSAPDDPYYLVQFYGPTKDEWLSDLEALGVAFLGYHPHFTFIARMDPALEAQVRKHRAVQWAGKYHPFYRLASDAEMLQALTHEGRMALHVRGFPGEDAATLQGRLEAAGVSVEWFSPEDAPLAQVWARPEQLPRLAALRGVYRVEAYDPPTLDNERSVQVMHTWHLWRAGRNGLLQDLMGAGQVAGMVDSGLDDNDTTPRINDFYDWTNGVQTTRIQAALAGSGCGGLCSCYGDDDANSSGHGTHVAGTIVANGYNALLQRGLQAQARSADPYFDYAWGVGQAPEARIAFAYVAGRYLGVHGTLCGIGNSRTTWQNVYNQGARNVNNSWGNTTATYGGDAINADRVMWENQDYLVLSSASNSGPGWNTVMQPGTGKNLIAVGASGNHRSVWAVSSETSSVLTDFSSRGPVNLAGGDGRFKPDVVAPGADVLSTRTTFIANATLTLWGNEPGDGDGDGQLDYWWSGGTSMSSPNVTGAATVIRDYFEDIKGFGSTTPPSAALIKAALANGAVDMGYGYESLGSAPYGGRNMQGWGMVNVEQSITPRAPRSFVYDDFTSITNVAKQSTLGMDGAGDYVEYTVNVVDRSEPLKVTVSWTDRQNGSDSFAVNNLDLLVTAPGGGTQYRGNVFSGSWSATGGSADTKNNTEAVYVRYPATGSWTIRVTATTINASIQPFAIVISGGLGPAPSYTRFCSGTTPGCSGRIGTSSQPYFPSLRPLAGTEEHTAAGGSFVTSFRLTNWGTDADNIGLSSAATDMSGGGVAGIAVSFDPTGPFDLASGAFQDVQATVTVGGAVANGPYDLSITATSNNSGNRRDSIVVGLNVLPDADLSNEARVISDDEPQFAHDFWGTGQTLWTAYLSGQYQSNSEAEVWAACSPDGGQTWSDKWQVDANDGVYYGPAVISGNADGSSVTVVWHRADSTGIYARTWTRTSGCSGSWGAVRTLASYGSGRYVGDPDVGYDNDGHILVVWFYYYSSGTIGIYHSVSTNNGVSWSAAAAVPDASGSATHRWPALALDTSRNGIWMAYNANVATPNRDVRLKRWDGTTNTWDAAGTRNIAVATTSDREIHPGISYIATTDSLWVAWLRYAGYANPTAQLYYARSSGTLPNPSFPTSYGPYGARTAEHSRPSVVGDASYSYIAYLAYNDAFRGGNVYMLRAPAAGGAPDMTYQLSATGDDPPLYARGNAGTPRLLWLQTTVNGQTWTGPTLLYSKNPPDNADPDYGTNLGVAQTLYNLEENFDLYLSQAGHYPTAVELVSFGARAESEGIRVTWETASERDNLGFNLYRSLSAEALGERLNAVLIPSNSPGEGQGSTYQFLDVIARAGLAYYYTLEDVSNLDLRTLHGPVVVTLWRAYLPLAPR